MLATPKLAVEAFPVTRRPYPTKKFWFSKTAGAVSTGYQSVSSVGLNDPRNCKSLAPSQLDVVSVESVEPDGVSYTVEITIVLSQVIDGRLFSVLKSDNV